MLRLAPLESGARLTGHAVSPREMKWPKPQAGSRPQIIIRFGFRIPGQVFLAAKTKKITNRPNVLVFLRTSYQDILGRLVLSDVLFWRNLMQHLVDTIFIGEFDDPNHDI